jgi:ribonucleoside-diphosphate reductase alpha chain
MEIFANSPVSEWTWNEKYRFKLPDGTPIDQTVGDTFARVAVALASVEQEPAYWRPRFYHAIHNFEFLPAGRIIAGAGTGRDVTLVNCFVMGPIPDSLEGIFDSVKEAALTSKQGGGIGMCYSTLRYRGAPVKGVGSVSSGAVSFMEPWHSMCGTIMSAGSRRGAMMGTLAIDHPDIEEFIDAKKTAGRLTNFNVSVLVTDAFMEAVENDWKWSLNFNGEQVRVLNSARDLWDKIIRSTYDYAEPGVIFIDRMNRANPLRSIETFTATNPCGEQPLPPYGACILGSINLAAHVRHPFTAEAYIDVERMDEVVAVAIRMLDNVNDVSNYPLEKQYHEAQAKRRIGLGITGFADMLIMLGKSYRNDGPAYAKQVMQRISEVAMEASCALAAEKGAYPLWKPEHGPKRRNSHLTSIAPTGTISLFAGNVSSGIEPVFDYEYRRKVLEPDGSFREFEVSDYAHRLYTEKFGGKDWADIAPELWLTAADLKPEDHLAVVAMAQPFVDSAISKTINCPADMPYEEFKDVYTGAYRLGLKGCTTYRPSGLRGAILSSDKMDAKPKEIVAVGNVVQIGQPLKRGTQLDGVTYKIKPSGEQPALYVTVNNIADEHGRHRPFELFFNSKAVESAPWMMALSRSISAVFRKGGDVAFIADELCEIFDPRGGFWSQGKYVPSVVAAVGLVLKEHMQRIGFNDGEGGTNESDMVADAPIGAQSSRAKHCPQCQRGALMSRDGCWSCDTCTYTKCG